MPQWVLAAWVWLSVSMFLVGCAWRAWRYLRAPVHLRWDLYPVPRTPRAQRAHGGSYFEQYEWWTTPRPQGLGAELTTLAREVFLLQGVWRNNRRLFWRSFPFHWGLYLLVLTSCGLGLGTLAPTAAPLAVLAWIGSAGGLLVAFGASALLGIRSSDAGLRRYTTTGDRLNLAAFALLGALSAGVVLSGLLPEVAKGLRELATLRAPSVPDLVAWQMTVAGLVLLYLPFTRMVHFFSKLFLYHRVRWDDRPLQAGGSMERRVRAALRYRVDWAAGHVRPAGDWVDTTSRSSGRDARDDT